MNKAMCKSGRRRTKPLQGNLEHPTVKQAKKETFMIHRDTQDHENNKAFSYQRERFGAVVKIQIFAFVVAFLALLCMTGIGSAVVYHEDEVITTDTTWAVDVHVINASSGFF